MQYLGIACMGSWSLALDNGSEKTFLSIHSSRKLNSLDSKCLAPFENVIV